MTCWFPPLVVAVGSAWVSGILVGRWVERFGDEWWPIDGEGER